MKINHEFDMVKFEEELKASKHDPKRYDKLSTEQVNSCVTVAQFISGLVSKCDEGIELAQESQNIFTLIK